MCCSKRRAARKQEQFTAAAFEAESSIAKPELQLRGKEAAAMTVLNPRSSPPSDEARMSQINGEVLRNAEIPPPTYDEATRAPSQSQSRPRETLPSSSAAGAAASQHVYAQEKRPAAPQDLSDPESFDSDWENETVGGIDTPATTVYGDEDPRDAKPLSREISNNSPPLLEYIRAIHGLPNVNAWTKEDWKAAKAAFKAERKEAKAHYKAERDNRRAAWKQEKKEQRENRDLRREAFREMLDEKRAARRGCC